MFDVNFLNDKGYQRKEVVPKSIANEIIDSAKNNNINKKILKINKNNKFSLKRKISILLLCIVFVLSTIDLLSDNSRIERFFYGNDENIIYYENISLVEIFNIIKDYKNNIIINNLQYDINKEAIEFKFTIINENIVYDLMNDFTYLFPNSIKGYSTENKYIVECKIKSNIKLNKTKVSMSKLDLKEMILDIESSEIDIDELINANIINDEIKYKIASINNVISIIAFLDENKMINNYNIILKFNTKNYKYDLVIK